ncbi:hypothetical protein GUJ93_ZPchr0002g23301 [Zizania palustris]|uniref:Cytochrome b5 heme-binding domain-containing protein n=1 Tax=Zizania palustris TaxID=103762 RepID=A0A8J5V9R6_ZIZPA|nr:hypothetical protein GUJ93_ZPchr0002g23301 [Zizania palustris]
MPPMMAKAAQNGAMPASKEAGGDDVLVISSDKLCAHAAADDLWICISGDVYDVTAWLPHHPGGDLPLLMLAGQDATDAFATYHPPSVSLASADFHRLLAQISSIGLFDRVGPTPMVQVVGMLLLFCAALYCVIACTSPWAHLLSSGLISFVWIQSGWMGHDSGHHRITVHTALDRLLQVLSGNCLTVLGIAWWKFNHNTHHIACNSLDHDPDLQHMPLFVVSSKLFDIWSYFYEHTLVFDAASKLFIGYRHWTFYLVMCIVRINLLAQSASMMDRYLSKSMFSYPIHM